MKRKNGNEYYQNRHSCFLLQYHIVLVTKYRTPALSGVIKDSVYSIIRDTCIQHGIHIIDMNGEPDHVHLLIETPPDVAPQQLVNILKTRSARITRRDYPNEVHKYFWGSSNPFWTDSYFVATVGQTKSETVRRYISNQSRSGHSSPAKK
jgi:putative transposase